jgi:hypothetical protein
MNRLLATTLVVAATATASLGLAQTAFEQPPVLKASDLAPAASLSGPGFTVDDRVPVGDFLARFVVRSEYGVFQAHGRDMLAVRVQEVHALNELEKTSKTNEFLRAAGSAAARPVQGAANIVMHPVETVSGIPTAAGRWFDRVSLGTKAVSKASDEGGAAAVTNRVGGITADVFGYEAERRALAKRLGVDPYTTNHVLSQKMTDLAWVAFSGRVGLNTVVSVVVPFSMALSATTITNDLVWDMKPADLIVLNEKKLKGMGVPDDKVAALMGNRWYSITMLTSLVEGLERLNGVKGREQAAAFAAAAPNEDRARMTVGAVQMLARYHASAQPLVQIVAPGPIFARTKSGGALIAAPIDYVPWTEPVAAFARRPDVKAKEKTVWITGMFSPTAKKEFEAAGWTLREGPKP